MEQEKLALTYPEELGKRIREGRERQKMSQEELAHSADISPNYLRRVEAGKSNITVIKFVKLLDALGLEGDRTMGRTTKPATSEVDERIQSILDDCTLSEREGLLDLLKTAKETMRKK